MQRIARVALPLQSPENRMPTPPTPPTPYATSRHLRRSRLGALALAVAAWASSAGTASAQTSPFPADALVVWSDAAAPGVLPSPSWREAPHEWTMASRMPGSELLSHGMHSALVRLPWGDFVVDLGTRELFPIDRRTVGRDGFVGDDDDLLRLADDGALLLARRPYTEWTELRLFAPDAPPYLFDSAGRCVVATAGEEVYVSSDAGATFVQTKPSPGMGMSAVYCRFDGVAVAAAPHEPGEAYLWHPDDAAWTRAPGAPSDIRRDGAIIHALVGGGDAVLSIDGRTWSDEVDVWTLGEPYLDPTVLFILGDRTQGWPAAAHWYTEREPAPPAVDPTPPSADPGEGFDLHGSGAGNLAMLGVLGACQGFDCLHGTAGDDPRFTRTFAQLLATAVCAEPAADAPNACPAAGDADWVRPPALVVIDDEAQSYPFVALPRDCADARVESIEGLVLALCADAGGERVDVFARSRTSLDWVGEATIEAPLHSLQAPSMGPDGTIALHMACACDEDCAVYVRRPRELGEDLGSPWLRYAHPGARAWRPLTGGAALAAVTPDRAQPDRVVLAVYAPEGPPTLFDLPSPAPGADDLRVESGRPVLRARGSSEWLVPLAAGGYAPVALPDDSQRANRLDGVPTYRSRSYVDCAGPSTLDDLFR